MPNFKFSWSAKKPLDKVCCYNYNKFVATKKGAKVLAAMKKGTKLTDNPKDYMLRVRMDNDTLKRLDELCGKYNTNRSAIVRMGIDKLYQDK